LEAGVDPGEHRKAAKRAELLSANVTFEKVAQTWFDKHMADLSDSHKERTWNRLVADIFPWLGSRPISEIKAPEILECLRRIEARGAIETAGRVRWPCSKVFRFAMAAGVRREVCLSQRAYSREAMSENTVNAALRRLGYAKDDFTGHSFRKIASTLLNESHLWHRDAIERQLAHGERDEVRATYNHAEHLPERTKMMQWWPITLTI